MRFKPCIDLHGGKVKQIVGSTLRDSGEAETNFVSNHSPAFFADLYHRDNLPGGHVIMLGPGNEDAAREALGRHPGLMQLGGGVTPDNAADWLAAGASKVIVTSYIMKEGELDFGRLAEISRAVTPERLVLDLSCVPRPDGYHVAYNRWQTVCNMTLREDAFARLSAFCSEFLVHAVQVEGRQCGVDARLVSLLAQCSPLPVTYAGGIRSMDDILAIGRAGSWRVNFTVGSALDIFGGPLPYDALVADGPWDGPTL